MKTKSPTKLPYTRERTIDLHFIEHRGKVLDLAAFLDRVERAPKGDATAGRATDYRIDAMKAAIGILGDDQPEKARRVLELWSDQTAKPIALAPGKGAAGVAQHPPAPKSKVSEGATR